MYKRQIQIVVGWIAFALCQLDEKYLLALGYAGEVYEEEFIEASFANQLRRQHGDVIAGGGYEDGRLALLHPREKRRQQARRNAGVGGSGIGTAAGENFFQFVDPQHAGREALGNFENSLDSFFRLADEFVVDCGGIELYQRNIPFAGDGARTQALAASLHAENDDTLGRIETELEGARVPGISPLREPAFQILQAAYACLLYTSRCV